MTTTPTSPSATPAPTAPTSPVGTWDRDLATLQLQTHGRVLTVIIDRPAKLNALNAQVLTELAEVAARVAATPRSEIAGVILTGAGDRAFVAGADIAAMSTMTPHEARAFATLGQAVPDAWEALDRPVIACVNGYALGGGCEMALGCDFVYATTSARFGQPEVSLGLIPCFGGCTRLARQVGPARARELVYTGRVFDAAQAQAWGLVNEVFPNIEAMLTAARKTLGEVAMHGPCAVAHAKQAIAHGVTSGHLAGLSSERDGFAAVVATDDMREGTAAFLAKRPARFVDR